MKDFSRKRVFVAGGAGFLGSPLCERLLEDENEVLCAYSSFASSKDNERCLLSNGKVALIRHDVISPSMWKATRFSTWLAQHRRSTINMPVFKRHG